jgi:hypothetical protein
MAHRKKSDEERFWEKVHVCPEGCWEWIGSPWGVKGYGAFWDTKNQRRIRAHRYSYELAYGKIPDGLLICHKCDNPPCVRPDHLFAGTTRDNSMDLIMKGLINRGERIGTSKLKEHQALEILLERDHTTARLLAERFNVSVRNIHNIWDRDSWRHLELPTHSSPDKKGEK